MRHSSSQKDKKFAAAKQLGKNARTEDSIIFAVIAFLSKALLKKLGSTCAQKEPAKIFRSWWTTDVIFEHKSSWEWAIGVTRKRCPWSIYIWNIVVPRSALWSLACVGCLGVATVRSKSAEAQCGVSGVQGYSPPPFAFFKIATSKCAKLL